MLTVTRAVEHDSVELDGASQPRCRRIRMMVVDDHPAVRLGLVQLLEGQRDFCIEAVCVDAESAVAEAELLSVERRGGGLSPRRAQRPVGMPTPEADGGAASRDHLLGVRQRSSRGLLRRCWSRRRAQQGRPRLRALRRGQSRRPRQASGAEAIPADRRHAAQQAGRNRAADLRNADGRHTAPGDRADAGHVCARDVCSRSRDAAQARGASRRGVRARAPRAEERAWEARSSRRRAGARATQQQPAGRDDARLAGAVLSARGALLDG